MGIVATLCAFALVIAGPGSPSASAANWQLQGHIEEAGEHAALLGISCPAKSLCVATGEGDGIAFSTNPTSGASAWHLIHPFIADEDKPPTPPPPGFPASPNPPKPGAPWYRKLRGVSCPSTGFCVAVTFDGYIFHSSDPAGGTQDWKVADIDGTGRDTHLMDVSCPSANLCVAVSGDRYTAGKILSSTNPDGGAAAWKVVQLDESLDLRGISCGTPSFCVAVAEQGRLLVSTNPTGAASAWKEIGTPGGPGNLQGVSCVAAFFCVVGNSGGNLLTSTEPVGDESTWREFDGGASVQVTDVDCLPSRQCIAVDNNGNVLTTEDATADHPAWSMVNILPYIDPQDKTSAPLNALFGVSCPSSSFCAISAADGMVFTNDDPFAAPPGGGKQKSGRRPRRPRVTIAEAHAGYRVRNSHAKSGVFFRFHANGKARGFLCKRDRGTFKSCHSPVRYRAAVGLHVFRVRAIGLTGLKGPIVSHRFRIVVNPAFDRSP